MDNDRELRIEPCRGAARAARRFVEDTLRDWRRAARAREILLVCHELVANAVVHAKSSVRLRLSRRPDRVIVEVTDSDPRLPQRLTIDNLSSVSGRGMMIVDQLAVSWGVHPLPDGKIVWAELVCDSDQPVVHLEPIQLGLDQPADLKGVGRTGPGRTTPEPHGDDRPAAPPDTGPYGSGPHGSGHHGTGHRDIEHRDIGSRTRKRRSSGSDRDDPAGHGQLAPA